MYVVVFGEDAVLGFDRDRDSGGLTLIQRLSSEELVPGGQFSGTSAGAMDPEGNHLYLAAGVHGVVVLERDRSTGRLSYVENLGVDAEAPETRYLSRIRALEVDPSGRHLYAAEVEEDTLAVFQRNPATGGLTPAERHRNGEGGVDGLLNPGSLAVSPSGQNVYITTEVGGVLSFRKAPSPCSGAAQSLCLSAERFELTVRWRTRDGKTGSGTAVPGGSEDSGLVWFFNQDNWEMLVKVLDGCGVNGHVWVFAAATTNVEYTLTVRDTVSGAFKEYYNPLGTSAAAITDTRAFESCGSGAAAGPRGATERSETLSRTGSHLEPVPATGDACLAGVPGLCLNSDRFRVTVDWRRRNGETGSGQAVAFRSDDSGLFWFFNERNWEMLVKVLNGCGVNDRYWVFSAATTNVEYTLRVTDTTTGAEKEYFNPLGTSAAAVTDTLAFETCP